jgi:hypothetical protein
MARVVLPLGQSAAAQDGDGVIYGGQGRVEQFEALDPILKDDVTTATALGIICRTRASHRPWRKPSRAFFHFSDTPKSPSF